jgi:cytochrome c biogenesis protein ResB
LRSFKLAAVLLALLCGAVLVSFLVPQRALFGADGIAAWHASSPALAGVLASLGFESVFSSWLFVAICVLLLANLLVCTLDRMVRRMRRRLRALTPPPSARAVKPAPSLSPEAVARGLAGGRWRVRSPETGHGVLLEAGSLGWWGSMLLHAGLIVLILAGIVSAMTRFTGTMVLAEGQTLPDARASYTDISESPRFGSAFGEFSVGLDSMKVTYDQGEIVDAVASMSVDENGARRSDRVRVNQPLKVQGKSFLLGKSGHSVLLRVIAPDGEAVAANVNLGEAVKQGYADTIDVRGAKVGLLSVPDFAKRDAAAAQRLSLVDPAVLVGIGSDSAWLRPGDSAQVGSYLVSVQGVGLWTTLMVRADGGLPIAYVAFALVILGMIVRWLDPEGLVALAPADEGEGYLLWYRDRQGSRSARRLADAIASTLEREGEA